MTLLWIRADSDKRGCGVTRASMLMLSSKMRPDSDLSYDCNTVSAAIEKTGKTDTS